MQDKETADKQNAEACDDMASMLAATKDRVERARSFGAETTLRQRLMTVLASIQKAGAGITKVVVSIPGAVGRFIAMSSAERGQVYRGWWATIKKEAYHYWVSSPASNLMQSLTLFCTACPVSCNVASPCILWAPNGTHAS